MVLTSEEPIDFLFDKYFSVLVIFAKRYVSSYAVAEDIVQETFLHLWERESARNYSRAYLFTCVHNRAINHIKRNKQSLEISDNHIDLSQDHDLKQDVIEEFERLKMLFKALEKLPPKTLSVLSNVYLEEKSYAKVAQEMGLSINTVKAHMFMAFKLLKKNLLFLFFAIIVVYYYLTKS